MTADSDDPRWDLLPDDPEGFFELPEDFDPRDLKRSYNRLLRRFKPERFPAEFQQIRAAYESLNDALRYDVRRPSERRPPQPAPAGTPPSSQAGPPDATLPVQPEEPAERAAPPSFRPPVDHAENPPTPTPRPTGQVPFGQMEPSLLDRLDSGESLQEIAAELRDRPDKSGATYLQLALLADLLTAGSADSGPATMESGPSTFLDWLVLGLNQHPDHAELAALLREYLATEVPAAELTRVLPQVAQAAPADRFLYLTERAWDRLLRDQSLDEFRDCLRLCRRRLQRQFDRSELVFILRVLKRVVWKADATFVGELRETLEDHLHQLPAWLEEEYELVANLCDYHTVREQFLRRGRCCRRIDAALRDWCLQDETRADQSILDCQYDLSLRGARLLDELPATAAEHDLDLVLGLWRSAVEDVMDRQGAPTPPPRLDVVMQARECLGRLMRRRQRLPGYYLGCGLIYLALATTLVAVVTAGALLVRLAVNWFGRGLFWSGLWDGMLATGSVLLGLVLGVIFLLGGRRRMRTRYADTRRELFKLLRVTPLPLEELGDLILELDGQSYGDGDDTIDDCDIVVQGLGDDPAMEFFNLAQRCLHAADPQQVVSAELC